MDMAIGHAGGGPAAVHTDRTLIINATVLQYFSASILAKV